MSAQLDLDLRGPQPLLLVDVMNLAYRSHFRFQGLHNDEGAPTGVRYGFFKSALSLHRQYPAAKIVLCWDGSPPSQSSYTVNWRKRIYPAYKETRHHDDSIPKIVNPQLEDVEKIGELLGFPSVGVAGAEADDVIGIVSSEYAGMVVIYSSDHDLYQLLEMDRVKLIRPGAGKTERLLNQKKIENEYGIRIERFPDFLAFGGDHSDNVHPIPGVGEARAIAMVQAGARANKPFKMQQKEVRSQYEKYAEYWDSVNAAYEVVAIPRKTADARLSRLWLPKSLCSSKQLALPVLPYEKRLRQFTTWCSDYKLMEFLAHRREFIMEAH